MNGTIHPKRLIMFMDEVRKNYPETENSENYRFYYLYTDYQEPQEFLLVIVNPNSMERVSRKLHHSLQLWKGLFGFTESSVMTEDEFQRTIETQLRELQNTVRGTKYTSVFYEVW
jgi:protoporphyrinogen oxidase